MVRLRLSRRQSWGEILRWSFLWVQNSPFSSKPEPKALIKIGQSSQVLEKETRSFLNFQRRPALGQIFDPNVEIRIQNSPEEVLLRAHGERMYKRIYGALRWALFAWYVVGLRDLRLYVHPVSDPTEGATPVLKLRWRIEGTPRSYWLWSGKAPVPVLAGYSYYHFDQTTGLVTLHVVDRILPPATRGSWLWWWLERMSLSTVYPPKPLVGSSKVECKDG